MANILTEKHYLDKLGVQVLVSAISKLKSNINSNDSDVNGRVDDLLAKLGYTVDITTGKIDTTAEFIADSTLDEVYDLLTGLRDDLGKIKDLKSNGATVGTAIAALNDIYAQIGAAVETGKGDAEGTINERIVDAQDRIGVLETNLGGFQDKATGVAVDVKDDAFSRIVDLEERAAASDNAAFVNAHGHYSPANHTYTIHFGTKNTTIEDSSKEADAYADDHTVVINTDDFVKNGIIKDVKLIEAKVADKDTDDYVDAPEEVTTGHADGKKYIVIYFNTQADQSTEAGEYVEGAATSAVWLAADSLFNDYDFTTVNSDENYVTITVEETNNVETAGSSINTVKHTIALGETAKKDFALVEGDKANQEARPVEDYVNKTIEAVATVDGVTSGNSIIALDDRLSDLRAKYYGNKELTIAVDDLDEAVAETKVTEADFEARIAALRAELGATDDKDQTVDDYEEGVTVFAGDVYKKIALLKAQSDSRYNDVVKTFKELDVHADALKSDLAAALDYILNGTALPSAGNQFIDSEGKVITKD